MLSHTVLQELHTQEQSTKECWQDRTTRSKLFKYNILPMAICPFCEEEANIRHALIECLLSKITWENLNRLMTQYGITYSLKNEDIIFGGKQYM